MHVVDCGSVNSILNSKGKFYSGVLGSVGVFVMIFSGVDSGCAQGYDTQ